MTRFDPARRILVPEQMDTERIDPADLARCLADLERLSGLTLGHRPTLAWLAGMTAGLPPGSRLSVLDVACGGGDMLRAIWRWAQPRGWDLRLRGVDLNPDTVAIARAANPAGADIEYVVGDALALDQGADLIVNALFLHHLDDAEAVRFLRWLQARAARGWLVNDLQRQVLSYWGLRALTPLLGMHRFVRSDGPISVARGWSGAELRALAAQAGVAARLQWHLPFRWTLAGGPDAA